MPKRSAIESETYYARRSARRAMMRRMRIRIDASSPSPASEQLARAIRTRIERGTLAPGQRVPPVRKLALELGLATNTVAKAYRSLEAQGLLTGRGRLGTFVTSSASSAGRDRLLGQAAELFLARARSLGATDAEALAAVRSRIARD
jgi:DNA-binding transcriptional regulator YhcF (GntR family)